MLVSRAIELVRQRINDAEFESGYTDDNIIQYLNDAIKYLALAMIARNDPTLVKSYNVEAGTNNEVPKNFIRFAGGYPIRRQGKYFFITDGSTIVRTKFFCVPNEVEDESDELPFGNDESYGMLIVNLASIYALNQHEFNVERDTAMRAEMEKLILAALGEVN